MKVVVVRSGQEKNVVRSGQEEKNVVRSAQKKNVVRPCTSTLRTAWPFLS